MFFLLLISCDEELPLPKSEFYENPYMSFFNDDLNIYFENEHGIGDSANNKELRTNSIQVPFDLHNSKMRLTFYNNQQELGFLDIEYAFEQFIDTEIKLRMTEVNILPTSSMDQLYYLKNWRDTTLVSSTENLAQLINNRSRFGLTF